MPRIEPWHWLWLLLLVLIFGLPCASAVAECSTTHAGCVDRDRVVDAGDNEGQWLLSGKGFDGGYFSPLSQINRKTVGNLGFAWEFRDFVVRGRTHRGVEATPLFVDGVLYFSGPWGVAYAVDARSGKSIWTYDPAADGDYARAACCDAVNRGVLVWKGRVYTASLDGYLVALDASTGKVVWRADTFIDRSKDYTSTGAPIIAGDNVLLGNAGADMGTRGYVSAYDIQSGKLAWRFFATPGDPEKGGDETPDVSLARKTWNPHSRWDLGGGGAAWGSLAYDPNLNIAYLGFGNGGPTPAWVRSPGTGSTLFTCAIVAVDASTGHMKWYYQEVPRDSWDYDATSPMVLVDRQWKGRSRKLLMQAPKDGIFYVLDRETGELLKADPFTRVSWTDGIDLKTGRPHLSPSADYSLGPKIVWPGAPGGHAWTPMSYDPQSGWVYFPASESSMKYAVKAKIEPTRGAMFEEQGNTGELPPYSAKDDAALLKGLPVPKLETRLTAWDPLRGRAAWASGPLPFVSGGVLSTAGGLVFEGGSGGRFSVYDAANGKLLKVMETGTAIAAAPMTYTLDGTQYVAVLAGAGGPQGAMWAPGVAAAKYQNFERLLVFKLDGGLVPLPPPAEPPPLQPIPGPVAASPIVLAQGRDLFENNCHRCHMIGGAFGMYPNLWNMSPETIESFETIVVDGAFSYAGMASFADHLSKDDVAAMKAFIINDTVDKRQRGEDAGAHSRAVTH